ncbi:MAG: hypothetical protein JO242_09625, partial [Streptosporangiaceae bacterium]|nr:hypothetical protein [Streptosporangiaceae bacterium]
GMFGRTQPALAEAGAGQPAPAALQSAPTGLIGAMPEGGAEAIASGGNVPGDEELLDHAAMESGTD